MITSINADLLADHGKKIRVGMVDSGFSLLPSYATLHGTNYHNGTEHGDRMLSIFTALDRKYPLNGLELHVSCYNPQTSYDGLAYSLSLLPDCDILSISMSWKDDDVRVHNMLSTRFGHVCVPYSWDDLPYPASYDSMITCSNNDNPNADWSICPNQAWKGNSYAVPAIARLLAHGNESPVNDENGIPVEELFAECKKGVAVVDRKSKAGKMSCPHCHRFIRSSKTHGFILTDAEDCPYCGMPLHE